MKQFRRMAAALCAVVLLCGFSVTAYAGGGPEWEGLDPSEEKMCIRDSLYTGHPFAFHGIGR